MMNGTSDTARSRRPRPVLITFFAAALLVFSAAACTGEEGGNAENTSVDDAAAALQDSVAARTAQGSVLQAAMDDPDLSLFVTALDSAGLASTKELAPSPSLPLRTPPSTRCPTARSTRCSPWRAGTGSGISCRTTS